MERMPLSLITALVVVGLVAAVACTDGSNPDVEADRSASPPPSATEATSTTAPSANQPLGRDDLVMVFSGISKRGGDLFAMYGDGHTEVLDSPIARGDLYPSFVLPIYHKRGQALIVERRSLKSNASRLLYLSVPDLEKIPLSSGAFPAVDPRSGTTSRIAFAERRGGTTLVFADIATDYREEVDIGAPIGRLTFDAGGRFAYVLTDEEHPRLSSHDSTGELGPVDLPSKNEDVFLAMASDRSDSVVVVRSCCTAGAYRGAALTDWSLAEIKGGATGEPKLRDLVPLNHLGLTSEDLLLENLRLAPAGTLDANMSDDGRITWSIGEQRAWILGYQTRAWLIDLTGEITDLGEIANGGLALAPELLSEADPKRKAL